MIPDAASGGPAEAQRRGESQQRQRVEACVLVRPHLVGEGKNMQTDIAVNDTDQKEGNPMNSNPNGGRSCKEKQMNVITEATLVAVFVVLCLSLAALAAEPPRPKSPATARSEAPSLPFSLTVATERIDLPPYMWKKSGTIMDFPLSSTTIRDELWVIYANGMDPKVFRWKGTNIEDAVKEPDGTIFVSPGSTSKQPLKRDDPRPPVAKGQFPLEVRRPYIFGGMWYDSAEGKLYAPSHCELYGFDGFTRAVHLITSADKGLTWQYVGPIITRYDAGGTMKDMRQQAGQSMDGGPGDMHLTVDERSGYIYLYGYVWTYPKTGSTDLELPKRQCKMWVARCAIADKMAPGKWQKFHNGGWTEPGLGGKASPVRAFNVTYNTFLKKYISLNKDSSISVCSDLTRQDWSRRYRLEGDLWKAKDWWVTDENKRDVHVTGRTFYVYMEGSRRARFELGDGRMEESQGFATSGGGYWRSPHLVVTDPEVPDEAYAITPSFDSADPIEARRTRRCDARDVVYSSDGAGKRHWQGNASTTRNSSIEARFRGRDIYWRAVHDPESGKADVYIDDQFQRTVNLYSPTPTGLFMSFIRTGLDASRPHSIRIVVRGESDPRSKGAAIKHRWFECSAETYRASDGFSAVMGKERWDYLQGRDGRYQEMTFPFETSRNAWIGAGDAWIGIAAMAPAAGNDVVRRWVAPRDGTVRIEGPPTLKGASRDGLAVAMARNAEELWSAVLHGPDPVTSFYDKPIAVRAGDGIAFIARKCPPKQEAEPAPGPGGPAKAQPPEAQEVLWDPTVTYMP